MRITCVIGTRPEAIKISPVVHAARRLDPAVGITIVNSGQHQTEVASVLEELALDADEMLDDCAGLSLNRMTAALIASLGASTAVGDADLALVQGDTTTAFAGGLAAFHRRIPVAHLEAGLRSGIPDRPFPEEAHRTLLATLADVRLAPTNQARRNLRAMGVDPGRIAVTGNTCVDVLMEYGARSSGEPPFASLLQGRRLIL